MSSQPARSRGRGRGTGGPSRARGENRGRGRGRGIGRGGGGDGGGGRSGDGGPSGSPHLGLGGRGSGRGAGPSRGRGGPPAGGSRAPRDVCNFYWTTGSCTKAFDCTWKHIAQTNAPENAPPPEDIDFFSTEGLAINNGVVVDEQHKLKPSEAHNHLKAFLGDHYHFENTMRIDGFARIFASVNDRNKFWDSNKAQAFLDTIVHGNGLYRLGDLLRHEPVAADVGAMSQNLSFQRSLFPLLEFATSDIVLKTTMHQNLNAFYTVIEQSFDELERSIRSSMTVMIDRRAWTDQSPGGRARANTLSGVTVFKTLSRLFSELVSRFKQVVRNHPVILPLVQALSSWFEIWSAGVSDIPPTFVDVITSASEAVRTLTLRELGKDVDRLVAVVERESGTAQRTRRSTTRSSVSDAQKQQAFVSQLQQAYDPPGELREGQARHDNDFADIAQIRIAPTHQELMSPIGPYLPVMLADAPNHLPPGSIERHIDGQFRLLREELTASIRDSIGVLYNDLEIMWSAPPSRRKGKITRLEEVLKRRGGAYRGQNVFFHVYSNMRFAPVSAQRQSFTVGLVADAPDGPARDGSAKKRMDYWEHSKRLQQGSLVALIIVSDNNARIFLGTVQSKSEDIAQSARANTDDITLRVSFFDAEVALMALRREPISRVPGRQFALLVDNNIMFESLRPFLERLQTVEPTTIPFGPVIASGGDLAAHRVEPPRYSRAPGFRFKLQCLAKSDQRIQDLDVRQPDVARDELRRFSSLDPSQADALVDTLTRELALVQGPPGTGKSYTGIQLIRVLLRSKIKPIVLIAYTNHALDHLLRSVLDAGITNKLVRLGSRSTDERVAEYNLSKLEQVAGKQNLDRTLGREWANVKKLEEDMTKVMDSIQLPRLTSEAVFDFLGIQYPEIAEAFEQPPYWISALFSKDTEDKQEHGEWTEVTHKQKAGKTKDDPSLATGLYGFWKSCKDIQFLQASAIRAATEVQGDEPDPFSEFFEGLGFDASQRPLIPLAKRTVDELLVDARVWSMSWVERQCLAVFLEDDIRQMAYTSNLDEFETLRVRYKEACDRFNEVKDEGRRRLMSGTDLIGCTTTGAAKLISLLTTIAPKVLLVEEAGQVLESHVIATLVPSVEHLICIGDPQQLRPTLATYSLSMDSERGRKLFMFDRSLMERLSSSNWPMSQINVQRRMRPSISHFIRRILYPKLEDHQVVREYPAVQGLERDVVFFTHTNAENAEKDSVSKFNMFEVNMIKDLVLYFLKQGPYSGPGDIAVLCAYLGQLQKVRAALRDLKLAVSLDERDEAELMRVGDEPETEEAYEQVQVSRHIRLGTVDTFQGDEAKIVIVSLVRNSGSFEEGQVSIGFLKSSNRINVALSRAKHGMYLLGNAANLMQNPTWRTVLEEMEANDQIMTGLPVACPRHPDQRSLVTQPGQLTMIAPEGGCLQPCTFRMACGHVCPSVCHEDRDNHRRMKCDAPCLRIQCPRGHPCPKTCSEDCGLCEHPIYNVSLPCGHVKDVSPCHAMDDLSRVFCKVPVIKDLPSCEHQCTVPCSRDVTQVSCEALCGGIMPCCSRTCNARCSQCQDVTRQGAPRQEGATRRPRSAHRSHPCERVLVCQHQCGLPCSQNHRCNQDCAKACRQQCIHHRCRGPCSDPCPPCMEPCPWACPHSSCPVLCGSICSRLPCDEPCPEMLRCGHPCPSVCGEPCADQVCVICIDDERKDDIVDSIMQRTLKEVDPTSADIAERLITLACGHIYTVETLDGHCDMRSFYEVSDMGEYLATKAPPVGYRKPPTCPTCRGPITALRYGRATKRANLDVLEQNVANSMSKRLDAISPEMERLSRGLEATCERARQLPHFSPSSSASDFEQLQTRRNERFGERDEPLPLSFLTLPKLVSMHGLSPEEARKWTATVRDITRVYSKVADVARTRGPHIAAYHAALSTLYRLELATIAEDPARASFAPEPLAMKLVNQKIGQPPHKADTRFQAEAFFLTLELRFLLSQVVMARIAGLPTPVGDAEPQHHRRLWESFAQYIHESCVRDGRKALALASASSASRIAARAAIHVLRAEVEQFRFDIATERDREVRSSQRPLGETKRAALLQLIAERKAVVLQFLERTKKTYLLSRPLDTTEDMREERLWFDENCGRRGDTYLAELDNLAENVRVGDAFQPLSLQEKQDIVKAFNFAAQGHFYNCENGHTFVITECGGAMQTARCPECRAPIGGESHALLRSNTRAAEFDTIAQELGARGSDWANPWRAL